MQDAFGGRKSLMSSLAWAALIPAVMAVGAPAFAAIDPDCNKLLLSENRLEAFQEHPVFKGQPIQVMAVSSPESGQTVWIGGVATAMKHAGPEVSAAVPVIEKVVGFSNETFEVSTGLNGSAARYALFGSANDLDILAQLVIKVKGGDVNQLFQSRSAPLQKVAKYLQDHVERVLAENPTYRFIELKAGEYLDPETGERQGIKWWIDDLRKGYKVVKEPSGVRRVSLAQAIAEPARIKIDWALPSPLDSLNEFDYTEVTTIYTLGMRVGNNQARLRISELPGTNESLVIKATSINLSREDLLKSIELSVGENPTTLEHVHQGLIKTIEKYADMDRLKVLKRLFALLSFWEGPNDFAIATGAAIQSQEVLAQVHEVLSKDRIRLLSRIRSRADVRMIAHEHGVTLGTSDADWLAAVKRDHPELKAGTIEELDQEAAGLVEGELSVAFGRYPLIPQYIDFVRRRATYVVGQKLTPKPVFLSLKPDAGFRAALRKKIRIWQAKYPLLKFVDPEDAHMTVHFAGRMSNPAMDAWIQEAQNRYSAIPAAQNGGLHIMGRRDQVIALKFDPQSSLSEMAKHLRSYGSHLGSSPEKNFLDFTPHITVATIQDAGSDAAQAQVRKFLSEDPGFLSTVTLERFEILTSNPEAPKTEESLRYQKLR